MRTYIDGVGHRNGNPIYDLEDACEEFLASVKRALHRVEKEDGDLTLEIVCDLQVNIKKPLVVTRK